MAAHLYDTETSLQCSSTLSPRKATICTGDAKAAVVPSPRRTPKELAEYCEQRVALRRGKESATRREAVTLAHEREIRSQLAGKVASTQAAQRLRERREKQRQAAEKQLKALVEHQDSSLEAMNLDQMLSPRFQERVKYTPAVAPYSAEDQRVKRLLSTRKLGSYYY